MAHFVAGFLLALSLGGAGVAQAADELTLYFIPSPVGISWASPAALTRTSIRNSLSPKNHQIGHVVVALQCDAQAEARAVREITGMTGAEDANSLIVREGVGLGVLFYDFDDGRLTSLQETSEDVSAQLAGGRASYLNVQVSPSTCLRLATYLNEYRERGYDHHYGLANRPRSGEGAGCSAFGASFLELAGLMTAEWEESWSHVVEVPERLIGSEQRPVRLMKVLAATRWAGAAEPHRTVVAWDPDAMDGWLRATWDRESARPTGLYALKMSGQSPGLRFDARDVATPTDPIWRSR